VWKRREWWCFKGGMGTAGGLDSAARELGLSNIREREALFVVDCLLETSLN
jgi:hypothetical protein